MYFSSFLLCISSLLPARTKLDRQQICDFFWTNQRTEAIPKSGNRHLQGDTTPKHLRIWGRSYPTPRASKMIKFWWLAASQGWAGIRRVKFLGVTVIGKFPPFCSRNPRGSHREDQGKSRVPTVVLVGRKQHQPLKNLPRLFSLASPASSITWKH